ncbi:BamA/TamA family outer membrane protein [Chryseolinea sp. T2]|uniref:BamA/TamA family outer membrane protein n=1 Tax=Chryseolinea sp. T2 TaxID=3129255 RepID=UPI003078256B
MAIVLLAPYCSASDVKVILTGNTADLKNEDTLFEVIDKYCSEVASPVLWVLNGDIFSEKASNDQVTQWQSKAFALLDRFPKLQILINQGDRDWDDSGKNGWKKVQSLEKLLQQKKHERFQLFIERGCPGPWTFSFSPLLEVVVINSQWWNHPYDKPTPFTNTCQIADTGIFIEELEGILDEARDKNIMVLSHYPLESLGSYGGRFPASTHLLPPIIGSAMVGFHQNVGSGKDIGNSEFEPFRHKLDGVMHNYASLVFASAHELNHSILKAGDNFYVNSGALDDGRFVASNSRALFTSSQPGFIEITYGEEGDVKYQFFTGASLMNKGKGGILMHSPCQENARPGNTSYNPCSTVNAAQGSTNVSLPNPATAVAGSHYASSNFKQRWLGKHYRASWTVPVKVPYLDMDTAFGGLIVNGKGGGRQTTSLKLTGNDGREYVFRSVDKDPSKALPVELRGTIISEVLRDQTSTQQPYSAMAVAYWLEQLNILHATPALYVLPDDDALGMFRKDYANLFGMLEIRPTDKIQKDKIFGHARDIEKSFKMFDRLYSDHDNRVEKSEFVRARMFDLWIGDWSKHEDNWKWAGYKDKHGEVYRPIPRDRDHAFSRWDGIIPWLGDREWAMPNGENFDYKIKGLRSLMWQARHLDRFVTSDVTKDQWINAAEEIQRSIDDKDIEEGVRKMPAEIYHPDGSEIETKLKARIKDLPVYAEHYYNMLSREVDVVGSNKKEYFHAVRNADGTIRVAVYDIDNNGLPDSSRVYFQRTFYPHETNEVRLFGLQGDDVFVIEGDAHKSILIRVVGDDGHDSITDRSIVKKGNANTLVYERGDDSTIQLGTEGKRINPGEEEFYHYDRTAFKYNTYLPLALVSYNPFTGFAIQGGVTFTQQRFAKPDFSAKHRIKASVSTSGNYEVSYANQFRYLLGKWDGISEIVVSRPLNYNYFFGIGNNTENDQERSSNYYRAQYNMASVSAGLTRSFWGQSRVAIVASYEMDEAIKRENSFLYDNPDVFGIDKLNLVFLKGTLDLDFRDRTALPEHGFRLFFNGYAGHVSKTSEKLASVTELHLENYVSTWSKNPFTLGLELGGGITDGQLPFYKLFSIGQTNNLNGFKRNRFTGESKAFLNTEVRWQLTETRNTFIPLKVGLRAFYDIARVWADSDDSSADIWHYGYGGGFYITPFREQLSSM